MGTTLELTAADGHRLAAYRAEPAGKARGAIVVIQEIFGVNSHIKAVTDGFAADGYLSIAPALFDRVQRDVDLGYSADDIAKGRALKDKSPIDAALRDVQAACAEVAQAGRIGMVGYCWGGFVTWMAAARLDGLACAAPYYGGGILDNADVEPRCPVMAHFGERDSMIAVEGVRKLAARHTKQQIFIYAADHGFNCDQRGSFDAPSAKLARERTVAFFRQHVG
jgi:carboxymethylenebutenolidase